VLVESIYWERLIRASIKRRDANHGSRILRDTEDALLDSRK
jgi:hypothetical protein